MSIRSVRSAASEVSRERVTRAGSKGWGTAAGVARRAICARNRESGASSVLATGMMRRRSGEIDAGSMPALVQSTTCSRRPWSAAPMMASASPWP